MSSSCQQCGAELVEEDAFCTKCGARRSDPSASVVARRFCTKCGAALGETKFCTKCGAPVGTAAETGVSNSPQPVVTPTSPQRAIAPRVASAATPINRDTAARTSPAPSVGGGRAVSSATNASSAASTNSSGIPKVAIVAPGVVLLLIVGIVAAVTSLVHHVRAKVAQVEASSEIEKSSAAPSTAVKARKGRSGQGPVEDLIEHLQDRHGRRRYFCHHSRVRDRPDFQEGERRVRPARLRLPFGPTRSERKGVGTGRSFETVTRCANRTIPKSRGG